jgi:hypothetical protein
MEIRLHSKECRSAADKNKRSLVSFAFLLLSLSLSAQEGFFVENKGRIADSSGKVLDDILYSASVGDMHLYFRSKGFSYVVSAENSGFTSADPKLRTIHTDATLRIDVELVNSNPAAEILSENSSQAVFNYYYGHCPNGVTGLKGFKSLVYKNIYPHIDLRFFFPEAPPPGESVQGIMYDYIVHPGGNPSDIKVKYSGGNSVNLFSARELHIKTPIGVIREIIPAVYQTDNSKHRSTSGSVDTVKAELFSDRNGLFSFNIGSYDPTRPLVIDPWAVWTSYLGSAEAESFIDQRTSIKVASGGTNDLYITGTTAGATFPTNINPPYQTSFKGVSDVFVSKFNSTGDLIWSTFIGGSSIDQGCDIDIDNISVPPRVNFVGNTLSYTNFPVGFDNPAYKACQMVVGCPTASVSLPFIGQLDANTGLRTWITFYGGNRGPNLIPGIASGVATGTNGRVFVCGYTDYDSGFPFPLYGTSACQAQNTNADAFLLQFEADGTLNWATLIGGSGSEYALAVESDNAGNAIVTGWTESNNFPVDNPLTRGGIRDAFIAKYDSDNTACSLIWSRYLGGSDSDAGYGIAADATGNIFVCGKTSSSNFPAVPASASSFSGGTSDAFLTKLDNNGTILWSRYYGGTDSDIARDIAVTQSGNPVTIGSTLSSNIPVTYNAIQPLKAGQEDVFFAVLDRINGDTVCASYFGGSSHDRGTGIAIDGDQMILICGSTNSNNFPLKSNPYQGSNKGNYDAFLGRLCSECGRAPQKLPVSGPLTFTTEDDSVLLVASGGDRYIWNTTPPLTNDSIKIKPSSAGTYMYIVTVSVGSCSVQDTYAVTVTVPVELLSFTAIPDGSGNVRLTWETATEHNSKSFFVERSRNAHSFQELAEVEGAGNSSVPRKYGWTDETPFRGVNYYRLRQTDLNGRTSYSPTRSVNIAAGGTLLSLVYPNPGEEMLSIKLETSGNKEIALSLTNVFGQTVLKKTTMLRKGENILSLDASELRPGAYILKAVSQGEKPVYIRWVKR